VSAILVKLPAELERFVSDQVKQGNYASPEQHAWLATEIQKGLDSGPACELDMEEIIRQAPRKISGAGLK